MCHFNTGSSESQKKKPLNRSSRLTPSSLLLQRFSGSHPLKGGCNVVELLLRTDAQHLAEQRR
jgi:hypothetical protein